MGDELTLDMFQWLVVLRQASPGQQRIVSLHTSSALADIAVTKVRSAGVDVAVIERAQVEGPLLAELDQVLAAMRANPYIQALSPEQRQVMQWVQDAYRDLIVDAEPMNPAAILEQAGNAMAQMAQAHVPTNLRGPRPTAMHLFTHAIAQRSGEIRFSDAEVEEIAREACRQAAIFDRVASEIFDPPPPLPNPFTGPSGPDERSRLRKG